MNNESKRYEQLQSIQQSSLKVFSKKSKEYGDPFLKYGIVGALVRIEDKIKESLSITPKGIFLVEDEKLKGILVDLQNYAALALMLLEENKGKK